MKKQFTILLILVFLVLFFCCYAIILPRLKKINSSQQNSNQQFLKSAEFKKKEMCASYKEKIIKEIDKDTSGEYVLSQLFYSIRRDSCLYSARNTEFYKDTMEIRQYYYLIDYFTHEKIISLDCKGLYQKCYDEFETNINQYK